MKVSSNGRVHRNADEWREIIARFAVCGLSLREFCQREKINKNSFERWNKRLTVKEQNDFADITPIGKSSSPWVVEVELADGTIVRVGS
jgi:hypothetical protein